jgi:hypothetical protein
MERCNTLPYFDMRAAQLDPPCPVLGEFRHRAAERYVNYLRMDIDTAGTEMYKKVRGDELEAVLREYPYLR